MLTNCFRHGGKALCAINYLDFNTRMLTFTLLFLVVINNAKHIFYGFRNLF